MRIPQIVALAAIVLTPASFLHAQTAPPRPIAGVSRGRYNLPPDARFKTDILLVVAHPDDETMVAAYLAREIYERHKRVAVVYGTYGNGASNDAGPEQAKALAGVREIEARRAAGSFGITNIWFLTGPNTPSDPLQDVLKSLEQWDHGSCLEQLVRIVRLTRPSVVLALLPDSTIESSHGDHQAAGVLATEAFDMAGDPSVFGEQQNLSEGLSPWQPEKIYYFSNHAFDGQGPQYSSKEISPSRQVSYGTLAIEAFLNHRTQRSDQVKRGMDNHILDLSQDHPPTQSKMTELLQVVQAAMTQPVKLVFGKSVVPSGVTDDVFAGVVAEGVPFQRAPGFAPVRHSKPTLELGDPWNFYQTFRQAHGLDRLANIVPPEVSNISQFGTQVIPLIIENPLDTAIDVKLSVQAPDGWSVQLVSAASIDPHSRYHLQMQLLAPEKRLPDQHITVSAQLGNQNMGRVSLRAIHPSFFPQ